MRLRAAASLVMLLLAGCGFQLRSHLALSPVLAPLHVEEAQAATDVAFALRQALRERGYETVAAPELARTIITIHGEHLVSNVSIVSVGGKVQEYRLVYGAEFSVRNAAKQSLAPRQSVQVEREQRVDDTRAASLAVEQRQLRAEMVDEAVDQLLRVLAAALPSP